MEGFEFALVASATCRALPLLLHLEATQMDTSVGGDY